ncbi:hypothetical protein PG988_005927 [Apiospora saccharicola]
MESGDMMVDIKAEMRLSYRDHGAGAVEVREEWVKRKVTRRISKVNARRQRQDRAEEEPRLLTAVPSTRHASRRRLDAPREPRPRRGNTAAIRRADTGNDRQEDEEVVVAYIRIGFHMTCRNIPRYFEYSGRPIAVHTHDVRADLPRKLLPEHLDAEADDAAGALAILEE